MEVRIDKQSVEMVVDAFMQRGIRFWLSSKMGAGIIIEAQYG